MPVTCTFTLTTDVCAQRKSRAGLVPVVFMTLATRFGLAADQGLEPTTFELAAKNEVHETMTSQRLFLEAPGCVNRVYGCRCVQVF